MRKATMMIRMEMRSRSPRSDVPAPGERELFRELTGMLRGAGTDSAPLEALLILGAVGGQREAAVALTRRRAGGEPLAYILGRKEFMSVEMAVDRRVMVPRPETEILVETAERIAAMMRSPEHSLAHSRRPFRNWAPPRQGSTGQGKVRLSADSRSNPEPARDCSGDRIITYLDVGTGSGCIAVALLARNPEARAVAVDISGGALAVAKGNARAHGVLDRIDLICADSVSALGASFKADVLVSNPPYIADRVIETLPRDVREHEPRVALSGGPDGLDFYRRLAHSIHRCVRRGGAVVLEVGYDQASRVSRILEDDGIRVEETVKDLAGIDRVVVGRA